ncbi:S41 family peptidase [Streptomyces sp. NPDC099050]|uniref:S41 family peptidase n=1 Tax=Streptomyces sp. NPDC099050 TaxID=3366100 RepID=UPI0037FE91CF
MTRTTRPVARRRLIGAAAAILLAATGCAGRDGAEGTAMSSEARGYLTAALDVMEAKSLLAADTDWPTVRREAFARAGSAQVPADTYGAVRGALRALGDRHSQFMTPQEAEQALSPAPGTSAVPEAKVLAGSLGYLSLPAVSSDRAAAAYVRQARKAVAAADGQGAAGWIVDLRGNSGGDMWGPLAAVGAILGDGDVGAFVEAGGKRTPWTIENGTPRQYLATWGPAEPLAQAAPPVAVLTSSRTASAAEAVTIAFLGRPDTRSFGQATRGVPTGNDSHALPDGALILLTQAREADRTGRIHNGPLPPDEVVPDDSRDLGSGQDRTLEAAARWLRGRAATAPGPAPTPGES